MYTHQRLRDLARGALPDHVIDQLQKAAGLIESDIVDTPAADWSEFGAKVCLLFEEMTDAPTEEWLTKIRAAVRADVARLGETA